MEIYYKKTGKTEDIVCFKKLRELFVLTPKRLYEDNDTMPKRIILQLPWDHITELCDLYKLDFALIGAIVVIESAGRTTAVRYEPNWKTHLNPVMYANILNITTMTEATLQSFSWGLMQVMGTVARELGFCGHLPQLCEPEHGLKYGCMKVNELFNRFDELTDVISAYNQGTPRKENGKYRNQYYVDTVQRYMSDIQEMVK